MDREELSAWLRLTLSSGVGNSTARRLLAAFGLPQALFAQPRDRLAEHATAPQARALTAEPPRWRELVEATWHWLQAPQEDGVSRAVITLGDPRYPTLLLSTEDPPLLLYVIGASRWLEASPFALCPALAIVGSRNPTAQGAENAFQFAQALRQAGLTIVSGLARGVDAAAHAGALEQAHPLKGPATIAVVGTGLDRVYPRAHLALAHQIAQQGLLVSEYPLGTPPLAANFPKRNRIIAGLSRGTLVVEAALASGSLITARLASEQGREVFAIPGSIHAPQSRGCHALIRQGAKLVESAQDVLEELPTEERIGTHAPPSALPEQGFDAGSSMKIDAHPSSGARPEDSALLTALGYDPVGLDTLVARTGMATSLLQVALLELELNGTVARLPGGLFQRLSRA